MKRTKQVNLDMSKNVGQAGGPLLAASIKKPKI